MKNGNNNMKCVVGKRNVGEDGKLIITKITARVLTA